jgi:hypothetical protein
MTDIGTIEQELRFTNESSIVELGFLNCVSNRLPKRWTNLQFKTRKSAFINEFDNRNSCLIVNDRRKSPAPEGLNIALRALKHRFEQFFHGQTRKIILNIN